MPVNSRYLKGPYRTTSSLYKAAQSASNKAQSVQDSYTKFLWNTNQISNEQYLSYAQDRASKFDINNPAQTMDAINWQQGVRSVKKEIAADYRARMMYEMALTPGKDYEAKQTMYEELYRQAAELGDYDAMLSIMTQAQNNMNAAAKAGEASARKASNAAYQASKHEIDMKRIEIKNDTDIDPLTKAASLADLDAKESQINLTKLAATSDETAAGNIIETIMNLQGKVMKNASIFQADLVDQNGNPFTGEAGQVITNFTPYMSESIRGIKEPILRDGYEKYIDADGKTKISVTGTGKVINMTTDTDGNVNFSVDNGKLDANNYGITYDENGNKIKSKIQREEYPGGMPINGGGEIGQRDPNLPPDSAYILDANGQRQEYNSYLSNQNKEKGDPYAVFNRASADKSTTDILAEISSANQLIKDLESKATRGSISNDEIGQLNSLKTKYGNMQDMWSKYELANKNLADIAKNNNDANWALTIANNKAIADAALKFGTATVKPTTVNPITNMYNLPANYPAPYRMSMPSEDEQRFAANPLNWSDQFKDYGYKGPAPTPQPTGLQKVGNALSNIGNAAVGGLKKLFGW